MGSLHTNKLSLTSLQNNRLLVEQPRDADVVPAWGRSVPSALFLPFFSGALKVDLICVTSAQEENKSI